MRCYEHTRDRIYCPIERMFVISDVVNCICSYLYVIMSSIYHIRLVNCICSYIYVIMSSIYHRTLAHTRVVIIQTRENYQKRYQFPCRSDEICQLTDSGVMKTLGGAYIVFSPSFPLLSSPLPPTPRFPPVFPNPMTGPPWLGRGRKFFNWHCSDCRKMHSKTILI